MLGDGFEKGICQNFQFAFRVCNYYCVQNIIGKAELIEILKESTGLAKKDLETTVSALVDVVKKEVCVLDSSLLLTSQFNLSFH